MSSREPSRPEATSGTGRHRSTIDAAPIIKMEVALRHQFDSRRFGDSTTNSRAAFEQRRETSFAASVEGPARGRAVGARLALLALEVVGHRVTVTGEGVGVVRGDDPEIDGHRTAGTGPKGRGAKEKISGAT